MILLKQSTTFNLPVLMVDSTDHITGKTGLTLTITSSKDGGAFSTITPTVTELVNGWYKLALTTGQTDTLGMLAIHITASGADPLDMICQVFASTFDTLVRSTTPANTLDVSATGEAGLDFANIKQATGSTTLNNIIIPSVTTVTTTTTATSVTNDVGITQAGADKVWGTASRSLTTFGTLIADIWAYATRTLSAFAFTVATNSDTNVTAIKAKTDLLPSNPASQTNLDVAVSTRMATFTYTVPPSASDIATAVWGATTRTLSSFGTLVADVWTNATRTLTTSSGITAQEVWEYATRSLTDKIDFLLTSAYDAAKTASSNSGVWANPTRTLTSSGTSITAQDVWEYMPRTLTQYAISTTETPSPTDTIVLSAYTTNVFSLENISDDSQIWFTVKQNKSQLDSESILMVSKTGGLLYVNGSIPITPITSSDASLVVVANTLTATLSSGLSALLVDRTGLFGEIKTKTTGGVIEIKSRFYVNIINAITKAV